MASSRGERDVALDSTLGLGEPTPGASVHHLMRVS